MNISVFTWNLQNFSESKARELSRDVADHIVAVLEDGDNKDRKFLGTLLEINAPPRTRARGLNSIDVIVDLIKQAFDPYRAKYSPTVVAFDCGGLAYTREWIIIIYQGIEVLDVKKLGFPANLRPYIDKANHEAIQAAHGARKLLRKAYITNPYATAVPVIEQTSLNKKRSASAVEGSDDIDIDEDGGIIGKKKLHSDTNPVYSVKGQDYHLRLDSVKRWGAKVANQETGWYRDGCVITAAVKMPRSYANITITSAHLPGPNFTSMDKNIVPVFVDTSVIHGADIMIGDLNHWGSIKRRFYKDLSAGLEKGTTLLQTLPTALSNFKADRAILRKGGRWKDAVTRVDAADPLLNKSFERISDHAMLTVVLER